MSHTAHPCQQPLDDDPRTFAYAGIGSRQPPLAVLDTMARIAHALGNAGVALSTGGADGADQAFETGALRTRAPLTVHTPWPGYNGYRSGSDARPSVHIIRPHPADTLQDHTYGDLARRHHPAWDRLRSRGVRAPFVRNVSILAGALDADGDVLPVRAVIAYTPNGLSRGRAAGGTGHTLRIAEELGIPAVNLAPRTPPEHNAAALAAVPDIVRVTILDELPAVPR